MTACRCGRYDGTGDHLCHGPPRGTPEQAYTCPNVGTPRHVATRACLAGAQPKTGAYVTWACDECWTVFRSIADAATRVS